MTLVIPAGQLDQRGAGRVLRLRRRPATQSSPRSAPSRPAATTPPPSPRRAPLAPTPSSTPHGGTTPSSPASTSRPTPGPRTRRPSSRTRPPPTTPTSSSNATHGRVTAIPINWYLGHEPAADSPEWDTLPARQRHHPARLRRQVDGRLRQHRPRRRRARRLLQRHHRRRRREPATRSTRSSTTAAEPGRSPFRPPAFNPSQLDDPHHDYPGLGSHDPDRHPRLRDHRRHRRPRHPLPPQLVARRLPVAVAGGCQSCGMGVTVQTDIGLRYTYCHNSDAVRRRGPSTSPPASRSPSPATPAAAAPPTSTSSSASTTSSTARNR